MDMLNIDLSGFIKQHGLPAAYQNDIVSWFAPLAESIKTHHTGAGRPIIVGINGAQGSGKSTLANCLVFLLTQQYQLHALTLSLDDFYFTRAERQQLARQIHPLLATRGVPGTHDIPLAVTTLDQLLHGQLPVKLPRFNKALDDRYPPELAETITEPVDIIIIEGWCLGAEAQEDDALLQPLNELEATEDRDGCWRHYVNRQLAHSYPELFSLIDVWVMLKAPSFQCVYGWRLEQENQLRRQSRDSQHIMDAAQLARFIQFYQRITENTLKTLPAQVHFLFELDEQRRILRLISKPPAALSSPQKRQWLIFTDLDGSLLDHHHYHFDAAIPTLKALENQQIPVIPVTSKTRAELELLRDNLNNPHPYIVENGAAVFIPVGYFADQPEDTIERDAYWVKEFVAPRSRWQTLIDTLRPRYPDQFRTFAEAGIDGIISMTGLNVHAAARAANRQYGEPVAWQGNGNLKQHFIRDLQKLGAHCLEGGRFIHVSGDCNKGRAAQWLKQVYQAVCPDKAIVSLAIGDSQNDLTMLEQADYALLIRSPVHPLPEIQRTEHLTISTDTGPKAWAAGVNHIINTLSLSDSSLPRGSHG